MKKTKTKKVKGGFVAFLAACLLTVNVAPAMAGGENWWVPILFEICMEIAKDKGGDKIPCWSAGTGTEGTFVICDPCRAVPGHFEGPRSKCTR